MTDVEQMLLKRSQQGEIKAFEELIAKHQLLAYNIAYRIMGNEEDAKDATQEALIKVFKHLNSFNGDSQFSTWLYRIVVNSCKDLLRKSNRQKVVSIDNAFETDDGEIPFELKDEKLTPEESVIQHETSYTVQKAIKSLPEQNRTVIVLRDIQGLSYDEIASIEGVPIGTVKSRIKRGRDMLKEVLIKDQSFAFGSAQ